jgi:hypothetical protein
MMPYKKIFKPPVSRHRRVYHGGDHIYKEWYKPKYNYDKLHNIVELIKQVEPSYILEYGEDEKSVWAKIKLIEGTSGFKRKWNSKFIKKIVNFIVNHYKSFYPIYHGDPSLANILITNDGTLQYIDYDDIAVRTDKMNVLLHIQKKCVEGFGEKHTELIKQIIGKHDIR